MRTIAYKGGEGGLIFATFVRTYYVYDTTPFLLLSLDFYKTLTLKATSFSNISILVVQC